MNIYCGNIAYTTTEDDLRDLFSQHGEVSAVRVITDRDTGRSKGFGFVEMVDDGGMIFFQDAADLGFCCNPLAEGNVAEVNACLDQVPFSACS